MSTESLNYRQFSALNEKLNYQDEYGSGFSVRAYGPDAGEIAKDAYMVSDAAHEQHIPYPSRTEDLMTYAEAKRGPLSTGDTYFGAWAERGASRGMLDVSRAYPRNVSGRARAQMAAYRNRQDAFGEVNAAGGYEGEHRSMGPVPPRKVRSYRDLVLGRVRP